MSTKTKSLEFKFKMAQWNQMKIFTIKQDKAWGYKMTCVLLKGKSNVAQN